MTKRQKTQNKDTGAALSLFLLASMTTFFIVLFIIIS